MKSSAKQLEKESQKSMNKANAEKKRIKTFLEKGDMESAKIVASEAIRFQKESVNLNRMGAKMGAVALKLDSAYRTQQVSAQIKQATPSIQAALNQMNSVGISQNMGAFEKVFEDLDVQVVSQGAMLDGITGQSAAD